MSEKINFSLGDAFIKACGSIIIYQYFAQSLHNNILPELIKSETRKKVVSQQISRKDAQVR